MRISKEFKNKIKRKYPFVVPIYSVLRNWRLKLMKWRPTYEDGGLITDKVCEFRKDTRFRRAFDTAIEESNSMNPKTECEWEIYVACWVGKHGINLEGDFVECGVATGFTSRVVMEYLDFGGGVKKKVLPD